jgi:hypothetical protein
MLHESRQSGMARIQNGEGEPPGPFGYGFDDGFHEPGNGS